MQINYINILKFTIQDDYQLLKNDTLSQNNRNCLQLRIGEKEVLIYFVNFTNLMIPLMSKNPKVIFFVLNLIICLFISNFIHIKN